MATSVVIPLMAVSLGFLMAAGQSPESSPHTPAEGVRIDDSRAELYRKFRRGVHERLERAGQSVPPDQDLSHAGLDEVLESRSRASSMLRAARQAFVDQWKKLVGLSLGWMLINSVNFIGFKGSRPRLNLAGFALWAVVQGGMFWMFMGPSYHRHMDQAQERFRNRVEDSMSREAIRLQRFTGSSKDSVPAEGPEVSGPPERLPESHRRPHGPDSPGPDSLVQDEQGEGLDMESLISTS